MYPRAVYFNCLIGMDKGSVVFFSCHIVKDKNNARSKRLAGHGILLKKMVFFSTIKFAWKLFVVAALRRFSRPKKALQTIIFQLFECVRVFSGTVFEPTVLENRKKLLRQSI